MFDLFYFQALAAKESRMRRPTRKSMEGEQGKNFFPIVINRENKRLS